MSRSLIFGLLLLLGGVLPAQATQPVWTNDTPAGQPPSSRYGHGMADEGNGKILMFGGRVGQSDVTETWEFTTATSTWRQLSPASSPAGREAFYLASEGNGKILLFGGFITGTGAVNDTWEWNGTTWTQLIANGVAGSPAARDGGAMSSLGNGQVLLFGGYKGGVGFFGDTWRWSGTAWSQVSSSGPSARYEQAMSNEAAAGLVLLFGGHDGSTGNDLTDTWEWNNSAVTWTRKATSGPIAREDGFMTLDKNGLVVLFGGNQDFNNDLNDTWEWNGSSAWVQKTVQGASSSPHTRDEFGMAYDSVNQKTVIFSGYDGDTGTNLTDTWTWNGTSWTQVTYPGAAPNPATRYGHALADEGGGKILLFSGYNGAFLTDTWEWNGTGWTQKATTGPAGRYYFAMADEGNGKILLFGGQGSGGLLGDTWEWNGTSWTQKSPAHSPSARTGAAMAANGSGTVLLFGGDSTANEQSDTWIWNGSDWVPQAPATTPTHRAFHSIVSEGSGKVLMFGGEPGSGLLNDTWEWSGTNWINKNPATSPSARDQQGMIYDTVRQRAVIFGGLVSGAYTNEIWEFNGTTWVNLVPPSAPSVRAATAMAYDASLGAVGKTLLFGGEGTAITNDTWDYTGTAPTLSSITLANTSPAPQGNVGFTVSFSEAVTGVDSTDFSLTSTGNISGASITGTSLGGAAATVMVSSGTGGGTLALKLTDDDSVRDIYGYPLGGPGTGTVYTGPAYTIVGKPNANNGSANVGFNTATSLTLSGTDTNSPPLALTYAIATNPTHGALSNLNASTGAVTYTPTSGYHGSDSFTFTASNGTVTSNAATVTLTIATGTPTANAQSVNVAHNTSTAVTLTGSDPDSPALALTYVLPGGATTAHGVLTGFNASTGAVTYTPAAGYHGSDSFTFTVSNGTNTSPAATVTLTVALGTPTATAQNLSVAHDTAQAITLAATDTETPATTLTYALGTSPGHGTLTGFNSATGTVTYTPTTGYHGTDSFTFTATNGSNTSTAATVSLTVAVGTPTATAQNVSTPANTALGITLSASDNDSPALPLTYSATSPGNGTLSGSAPNLTYTPANNFVGSDSFTFTASNGTNTSAAATVNVTVTGTAPIVTSANAKTFTIGSASSFTVTATGLPLPSLSESGTLSGGIKFTDNGNGTAILSGMPAVNASASYALTFTAHNAVSPDATQNFTLFINHPPTVGAVSLGATQNTPVQAPVAKLLASANDIDGDTLSITSVSAGSVQGGTVSLSAPGSAGTVTYTPANNFTGSDSFTFTVSDGRGGAVAGVVGVTVTTANNHTLNVVSITKTAAVVTVVYAGIPGQSYQPQYATTLDGGPWTNGGAPLTAGGNGQFVYTDTTQPQPTMRFYRAIAP